MKRKAEKDGCVFFFLSSVFTVSVFDVMVV